MHTLASNQVYVAENVLLDGRLALFHERQRWLVVADLHFGFELSQRAAGNLFPLWGMQTIEQRLLDLLGDYQPAQLVLLGDLVHDRAGANELFSLTDRLRHHCEVILIAGNHDRRINRESGVARQGDRNLLSSWETDGFYFHHGDCASARADCVQVIGHHHPAGVVRDGAGLHLKLPAFVQQKDCWIMPAFSPWAAGAVWPDEEETRVWLCSPERIVPIHPPDAGRWIGRSAGDANDAASPA